MTYRAWELKELDRTAVRELTRAIAEQNTEELEYRSDEPWSEERVQKTLAAGQELFKFLPRAVFQIRRKRAALHPGVLTVDALPGTALQKRHRRELSGKVDARKGGDARHLQVPCLKTKIRAGSLCLSADRNRFVIHAAVTYCSRTSIQRSTCVPRIRPSCRC